MFKRRLKIFQSLVMVIMTALGVRMYDIQVKEAAELRETALKQQTVKIVLDEIEKTEHCQVRYLYITSVERLNKAGIYISEFYQILRETNGTRTGEGYPEYYIFESRKCDEDTARRMKKRFGTLIIQDAGQYDENTVFAYADRDGNFLPGMSLCFEFSQ